MKQARRSISHKLTRGGLLLALVFLFVLMLCGCGGIMNGKMEVDSAFKGSRTITCSVSLNELSQAVEGGADTVHEIVEQNCPNALKYHYTTAAGDLTYFFTISFTDADSYRNLILSILPDSQMSITVGDGSFSTGIWLQEDFTDHDLMRWFDDALTASGRYKSDRESIWEQTSAVLIIDGKTVSTVQPFVYDTYQGVTLEDVSIYTAVAEDGSLKRDCVFRMLKDTYEAAGEQFSAYLSERMPENASISFDSSDDAYVVQTVSYSAADAFVLAQQNQLMFGSSGLFSASSEPSSAFSSICTYSEYLTFEAFPSEQYHYYVRSADAVEGTGLSDCYGGAVLHDNWLSYPVEGSRLSVSYAQHKSFTAQGIDVRLYYGLDGLQEASVQLLFTGESANMQAESASYWYDAVTNHHYPKPELIQTADGYLCSANLNREDGSLQCLKTWFGIENVSNMELENRLYSDRIRILLDCDFSTLEKQSGAKQSSFSIHLPQGMEFLSVRQDGSEAESFGNTYTVWNSSAQLWVTARVMRTDRIILTVLIAALLVILLTLCISAAIRMHLKRRGGAEGESFLSAMQESIKACFTGRLPMGADKEGVRYFYGGRGPQILLFVGMVLVPLIWSIVYLICYEKANSFYFFSGMLRYLSLALLLICLLTLPAAFIWRYYQKAPTDDALGSRMAVKTEDMAKSEIAQAFNRNHGNGTETLCYSQALVVPDAFAKRGFLYERLCSKAVRQLSRKFPDIENPVCVWISGDKIAASRSLAQNILLFTDRLVITSSLINPAFDTARPLATITIPIGEIRSFSREETVLCAHCRKGLLVATERIPFTKVVITTAAGEDLGFCVPQNQQTAASLKELAAAIRSCADAAGQAENRQN